MKRLQVPSSPDRGLADIELPEEDRGDVPVTPVTPRTPKAALPAPAPPLSSPPTIVVHAVKDFMNPTRPPQRVVLPEVVPPPGFTHSESRGRADTAWWTVYQAWEGGRARTILVKPLRLT